MTDKKLNLQLFVKGRQVNLICSKFPGGETHIRIDHKKEYDKNIHALIIFDFFDNADIIDLLLLTDALNRFYHNQNIEISLRMDYLPYARQDRVCNSGESLSVKVIADIINSQNYFSVSCKDIHSDVGSALINNLNQRTQIMIGINIAETMAGKILVSPDAGANKKVFAFAKEYGFKDVIRADKSRDPLTGNITGTRVFSDNVGDRDFFILDDICDGGRTFVELAKELRKLTTGDIYLFVTHGIFSAGLGELEKHFKRIFVSNLVGVGKNQTDNPLLYLDQ